MTPDQQKLIDAAAKALYEAWRQGVIDTHEDTPSAWPDISEASRDSYRRLVTIPVAVALRAAAESIKTGAIKLHSPEYTCASQSEKRRMFNHRQICLRHAEVISSLIPAREKTNEA
jgi:hypothetical protein